MPTCPSCSRRYSDSFERCSEDGTQLVQDNVPPKIAVGTTLDNGLTVKQFIGSGPTGEVYAAEHQGQLIALKLLAQELIVDQTFTKHLTRLMGHLSKVRHPGVAAVLSAGGLFFQGRPLFARELVQGHSLAELVRRTGPIPEDRGLIIAMRVAEALTEAHRAGALHLNLKPSNVFVGAGDTIKLVDFGIGERTELDRKVVHGDARFLAPEQFEGKLVSFRSDIYGLGTLLYFILTARPPFPGLGAEAERAVTSMQPMAPSSVEPNLSGHAKLDQVVLRALEKVPAKRYLSVQHFGRMMDGVLQEYHAHEDSPAAGGRPPAHRTIPMVDKAMTAPSPPSGPVRNAVMPPVAPPSMEDTLRMEVPPDLPPEDILDGPTLRERRPQALAAGHIHNTARQGVPVPPPIKPPQPGWQNRQAVNHETLRMPVAPAPVRPADTQPIPAQAVPRSQQYQHDTLPSGPPIVTGPVVDDIGIDIIEEETYLPPKKKKRKRKKKAPPIVAVRSEAALRLGPSLHDGLTSHDPNEAVMLDATFLDEARGPERNLATMEIRVRPPQPESPPPMPVQTQSSSSGVPLRQKQKPKKYLRWVLAAIALVFLFLFAAIGAAVFARWLSSSSATPAEQAPAAQETSSSP